MVVKGTGWSSATANPALKVDEIGASLEAKTKPHGDDHDSPAFDQPKDWSALAQTRRIKPLQPEAPDKSRSIAAKLTAPWSERVGESQQTEATPKIVGFYRDSSGVIRSLWGNTTFRSMRQIASHDVRRVSLLDATWAPVLHAEVSKGEAWSALPLDFRRHLEAGQILQTTHRDHYQDLDTERADPLTSGTAGGASDYLILHYSEDRSRKAGWIQRAGAGSVPMGRTGVLCRQTNGQVEPVLVSVDGHSFVVELKGCGSVTGGFGEPHFRTGRETITGGEERVQALNELDTLEKEPRDGGPRVAGIVLFEHEGHQQGYTVRLSPSTVRASFAGEAYPDITAPSTVQRVLQMYAEGLVRHLYSNNPRIMDRSSHTENILIWGDHFTWTDYSDQRGLASPDFPRHDDDRGYLDPRGMLGLYISAVPEVPGYEPGRDWPVFCRALEVAFAKARVKLRLDPGAQGAEAVCDQIWTQGMALQVFKTRRTQGYFPVSAPGDTSIDALRQKDLQGSLRKLHGPGGADFSGEELLARARQDLSAALQRVGTQLLASPDPLLEEALGHLQAGQWSRFFPLYVELYGRIAASSPTSSADQSLRSNAISTLASLESAFWRRPRRYLLLERAVLVSARSAPGAPKADLDKAIAEVDAHLTHYSTVLDQGLPAALALLSDDTQVKALLALSCYRR